MTHDVRSYDYVNHRYAEVRAALLADARGVFQRATQVGTRVASEFGATLHVNLAGLEIATDVAIEVLEIREDVVYGRPATKGTLYWEAARGPRWFPSMTATLSIYPLSPTETQLELDGNYTPPLGVVGAAIDTVVGNRIALAAINGFVREVTAYLREYATVPRVLVRA